MTARPSTPDNLTRELQSFARGGVLGFAGVAVGSVLGFVFAALAARGLGAAGVGALFQGIAVFSILLAVSRLGTETALVRFLPRALVLDAPAEAIVVVRTALTACVAVAAILGAVMVVGADPLARLLDRTQGADLAIHLRVLGPFLPIATVTSVLLAATRGHGRIRSYVVVNNLMVQGLRPFALLAVLVVGAGTVAVSLTWSVTWLLGAIVATVVVVRLEGPVRARARRSSSDERARRQVKVEFWRFSLPRGVASLLQQSTLWLDILLVGAFVSSRDAGIYAVANRYVIGGTLVMNAASVVIAPQVSRLLARDDRPGAQDLFQTATWWLIAVSWPLYAAMAVFAPLLMSLFGAEFARGVPALAILSVAMLVLMGTGNNKIVLLMAGGSTTNVVITASALAAYVGCNVLLIPRLGMTGAALAWTASILVDNVATTIALRQRVGLYPFGPGYLVVALAAVGCYGAGGILARALLGTTPEAAITYLVLASIPYVAVLWMARRRLRLDVIRAILRPRLRVATATAEVT